MDIKHPAAQARSGQKTKRRRTPRLAVKEPIRVFATDYRGRDFVEDSTTLAVNLHGAKIRLGRELIPEQEIRILSRRTGLEALFRVVSRAGESEGQQSFWGVESTDPKQNIWGIGFSPPNSVEQTAIVRVMLQCLECRVRELVDLDEALLQKIESADGLLRGCLTCGRTGHWKKVPYGD